ncbi:MAG: hypothetical protein HQL66_06400 [Magnetococcales bacterium]|nr:hypothetical protein [Magnetococcales bacterium]
MGHLPTTNRRTWTRLTRAAGLTGLALIVGCPWVPAAAAALVTSAGLTPVRAMPVISPRSLAASRPAPVGAASAAEARIMLAENAYGGSDQPVMTMPNTIMVPRRVYRPMPSLPIVERVTPVYPFPPGGLGFDSMDDGVNLAPARPAGSRPRATSHAVPRPPEVREEGLDARDLPAPPGDAFPPLSGQVGGTLPGMSGFGAADPDGRLFPAAAPPADKGVAAPPSPPPPPPLPSAHAPAAKPGDAPVHGGGEKGAAAASPAAHADTGHAPATTAKTEGSRSVPLSAPPAAGEKAKPATGHATSAKREGHIPVAGHTAPPAGKGSAPATAHEPAATSATPAPAGHSPYAPGGWPTAGAAPTGEKAKSTTDKPKANGHAAAGHGDAAKVEVVEDVGGKKEANAHEPKAQH